MEVEIESHVANEAWEVLHRSIEQAIDDDRRMKNFLIRRRSWWMNWKSCSL